MTGFAWLSSTINITLPHPVPLNFEKGNFLLISFLPTFFFRNLKIVLWTSGQHYIRVGISHKVMEITANT